LRAVVGRQEAGFSVSDAFFAQLNSPPTITLEQAAGFGLFTLKAVLSGREDEIVDLEKLIFLGRREGLSALAIRLLP